MTKRFVKMLQIVVAGALCVVIDCAETSHAIELFYEIDRQKIAPGEQVDIRSLLASVNERIGELGRAEQSGRSKILVKLSQKGIDYDRELMKRRISLLGNLEFCLLANAKSSDEERLVKIALSSAAKSRQVEVRGIRVAAWLPAFSGEVDRAIIDENSLVCRIGPDTTEVLTFPAGASPTGVQVVAAEGMTDNDGGPAIKLSFNPDGQTLLQKLEKQAKREDEDKLNSKIGMAIDGCFVGVATPNDAENEIVVHCDLEEAVDAILGIMNAGMLPYPIREIPSNQAIKSEP